MNNINNFSITGNVARISEIDGGIIISLAVGDNYKDGDEWVERTNFIPVAFFNENCEISVGDFAAITGKIIMRKSGDSYPQLSLLATMVNYKTGKDNKAPKKPAKPPMKNSKTPSKPAKASTRKRYEDEDEDEDDLYE